MSAARRCVSILDSRLASWERFGQGLAPIGPAWRCHFSSAVFQLYVYPPETLAADTISESAGLAFVPPCRCRRPHDGDATTMTRPPLPTTWRSRLEDTTDRTRHALDHLSGNTVAEMVMQSTR
jgi:hypothetical protein